MTKKRAYSNKQKADALANALMQLPENWLMCRDMRHAWTVMNDFHVTDRKGRLASEIRRDLRCLRCETVRREVYHQTANGLEKAHQMYGYPEHYQMKGVPRGNKPQALVQEEQFRRTMEKVAAAQKKGA